jgi:ribosomal protein S19
MLTKNSLKKNFIDNKLLVINSIDNKQPKTLPFKIKMRNSTILKLFDNKKFDIYNGYTYKSFEISYHYNKLKFGTLFGTRKLPNHKKK